MPVYLDGIDGFGDLAYAPCDRWKLLIHVKYLENCTDSLVPSIRTDISSAFEARLDE